VFWVISVYFNIRNSLLKFGTFLLGHPVYIYIYIYIWLYTYDLDEYHSSQGDARGKEGEK
jgi:hypothetical protein